MLKRIWNALVSIAPTLLLDLVGLVAVGLISYGAWLIYPPAGYIVCGLLLLIGVILIAKPKRQAGS